MLNFIKEFTRDLKNRKEDMHIEVEKETRIDGMYRDEYLVCDSDDNIIYRCYEREEGRLRKCVVPLTNEKRIKRVDFLEMSIHEIMNLIDIAYFDNMTEVEDFF